MVQFRNLTRFNLLKTLDVVVCLSEAWELLSRSEIFIGKGRVNSIREEDMVVDVDMLSDRLIWIQ